MTGGILPPFLELYLRPLALALCLVSLPALASPLASSEASFHLGAYGVAVGGGTTDTSSALLLGDLGGRWRRGPFVLDGFASASLPAGATPMGPSYLFAARAGLSFTHVTALLGATAQLAPGSPSTQYLPSLTVEAGTKRWRGVLGVNDRATSELLRVGVEYDRYSLSYLPLVGLEASARLAVRGPWQLDLRGFAYSLDGAESLGLVAGIAFVPGGGR